MFAEGTALVRIKVEAEKEDGSSDTSCWPGHSMRCGDINGKKRNEQVDPETPTPTDMICQGLKGISRETEHRGRSNYPAE